MLPGARSFRGLLSGLVRLATLGVAAMVLACAADVERGAVLRVGTSGDYPPFSEMTPQALSEATPQALSEAKPQALSEAKPQGFDVEVAEAFGRETGYRIEWVSFRWPSLAASLAENRFDVAMSGVTVRPERSVQGRFSVPVARTGAVLLVRESVRARLLAAETTPPGPGAPLAGLDVPELRVAVNAGGHLERVTRARLRAARVRAIPDNGAVPEAFAAGEVDAVVTDTLEAPRWLERLPGAVAVGPFTADWKAYWLQADDAGLAHRLDDWLVAREASGRLAAWRTRWFGAAAGLPTADPETALLAACDERLALMPFVAGFKRAHGLKVVDPEREARVVAAGWSAVQSAAADLGREAPPRDLVVAFYRAQIEAAVEVQRRILEAPTDPALARFDLQAELRPALIRIGDRMARLVVRLGDVTTPGREAPASDEADVARGLARHGLSPERTRAIARSLAAFRTGGG